MRLSYPLILICILRLTYGLMTIQSLSAQTWERSETQWEVGSHAVACHVLAPKDQTGSHSVVLLPDQGGIGPGTWRLAEQLVLQGYTLIIPNLAQTWSDPIQANSQERLKVLNGVLSQARQYCGDRGRLVLMGLGWGATQAFELATRSRLPEAVMVFDGKGPQLAAHCARISAPVYGFYGGADPKVQQQVNQLTRYMLASDKSFQPVVYPEVEQGFMSQAPSDAKRRAYQQVRNQTLETMEGILVSLEKPSAMR